LIFAEEKDLQVYQSGQCGHQFFTGGPAARIDVQTIVASRTEKLQPREPPPFNFSCSASHSMEPGAHVGSGRPDVEVAPFQWTVCQLAVYVLVMAACMSAS